MTPPSPAERLRGLAAEWWQLFEDDVSLSGSLTLSGQRTAANIEAIAADIEARERALKDALRHALGCHGTAVIYGVVGAASRITPCPICEAGRKLVEE